MTPRPGAPAVGVRQRASAHNRAQNSALNSTHFAALCTARAPLSSRRTDVFPRGPRQQQCLNGRDRREHREHRERKAVP